MLFSNFAVFMAIYSLTDQILGSESASYTMTALPSGTFS
jgi:hypothetical protein